MTKKDSIIVDPNDITSYINLNIPFTKSEKSYLRKFGFGSLPNDTTTLYSVKGMYVSKNERVDYELSVKMVKY